MEILALVVALLMGALAVMSTQKTEKKNEESQSNAHEVKQFTVEAGGTCPDSPRVMKDKEVEFITKMIIDEVLELLATKMGPAEAKELMINLVQNAKEVPQVQVDDEFELIGEQGDAFVDIWYYSLNAAAKAGINLSKIFGKVHAANMAKKDPATGKFIKRSDGKIIKPKGWTAPDIGAEIRRQMEEGSWS